MTLAATKRGVKGFLDVKTLNHGCMEALEDSGELYGGPETALLVGAVV